jgi:hypothetical protein
MFPYSDDGFSYTESLFVVATICSSHTHNPSYELRALLFTSFFLAVDEENCDYSTSDEEQHCSNGKNISRYTFV